MTTGFEKVPAKVPAGNLSASLKEPRRWPDLKDQETRPKGADKFTSAQGDVPSSALLENKAQPSLLANKTPYARGWGRKAGLGGMGRAPGTKDPFPVLQLPGSGRGMSAKTG